MPLSSVNRMNECCRRVVGPTNRSAASPVPSEHEDHERPRTAISCWPDSGGPMSQRRAVVTGGAGFLGSHLCERLVMDHWQVLCVDNLVTGREENIDHLIDNDALEFLYNDVSTAL